MRVIVHENELPDQPRKNNSWLWGLAVLVLIMLIISLKNYYDEKSL